MYKIQALEIAEMQVRDQTDKRIEVSTIPEAYFFANKGCNDVCILYISYN